MAVEQLDSKGHQRFSTNGNVHDNLSHSSSDDFKPVARTTISDTVGSESDDDARGRGGSREPTEHLKRRAWVYGLRSLSLHAPALITIAALIYINASGFFWFETRTSVPLVGGTPNILHLLQLVAKICEILLILSLSTFVFDVYRRVLATTGLPLGLITSGYRTGSLAYLTHSSLLKGLATSKTHLLFGVFIIFCTLLAILAGPTCAILVVPTAGWYPMGKDFADIMPPISFTREKATIWPSIINGSIDPDLNSSCGSLDQQGPECPGYGFIEIYEWAHRWGFTGDSLTLRSRSATTTEVRRQVFAGLASNSSATFATTASSLVGLIMASYFDFVTQHDVGHISHAEQLRLSTVEDEKILQPLTQAKCQVFDLDTAQTALKTNDVTVLPFWPMDGVECFDDRACASWQAKTTDERIVDRRHWEYLSDGRNTTFQFAEDHPLRWFGNSSFRWVETEGSLGAVFRMPYLTEPKEEYLGGTVQRYYITTCSFVSRWVPSVIRAQFQQTDVLQSNISDPAAFSNSSGNPPGGYPIQISKSWADYLEFKIPLVGRNRSATNTTIGAVSRLLGSLDMCWSFTEAQSNIRCTRNVMGMMNSPNFPSVSFLSPPSSYHNLTAVRAAEKLLGILLADALSRFATGPNRASVLRSKPVVVLEVTPSKIHFRDLTAQYLGHALVGLGNYTLVPISPTNESSETMLYSYSEQANGTGSSSSGTMAEWEEAVRHWMKVGLEVERHGYGFGKGSTTLMGAYTVVGVYAAMGVGLWLVSLTRLCCRACRTRGRRRGERRGVPAVAGWNDIQDLVALAWRSTEPLGLRSIGDDGINPSSSAWGKVLTVRITERGRLELVARNGVRS